MAADALALDTNVLVRLLTDDDTAQAQRAQQAIDQAAANGADLWLSTIVLCELVWVLDRAYGYTRPQCQRALSAVLGFSGFRIDQAAEVRSAYKAWQAKGGDFADHLIGHQMQALGCAAVLTFDKKAAKLATHRAV